MTNRRINVYNSYISITDNELLTIVEKGIRCNMLDSYFLKGFKGIDIRKQAPKSSLSYSAYKAGIFVANGRKKQEKEFYKKSVNTYIYLQFSDMNENIIEIYDKEAEKSDFFEIKEVKNGYNFALYRNDIFLKYFFFRESIFGHIYKYY